MNFTDKELEMLKFKERIIEKFINRELFLEDCVEKLQCSERTIFRLQKQLKEKGNLIHGLKGKPSNHQGENTKYGEIINIFRNNTKLYDFSPSELKDYLEEEFNIIINCETLRQLMIREGIRTPKIRKKKIKHQKRTRRACYGELVQFDGSYHDRFENGEKYCCLVAIDDSNSNIFIKFTKNENLKDVLEFRKEYLKGNGKPKAIYLDKHSTYKVNSPQDQRDEEYRTRFKKGMEKLGIEIIYANSPEAKGRVERVNDTLQHRLVKKMRLKGIKTIEEANKYVQEYQQRHNTKYGVNPEKEGNIHEKITETELENFYWIFSEIQTRIVKNDGTIQYKNREFQLEKNLILSSKKVIIKETIHGDIKILDGNKEISFKEKISSLKRMEFIKQ